MESNFNRRDFEDFIQENADKYRMFPSEKVWKKIHGTLHTRRRWYGAGLITLLLTTVTAVTWVMMSYPVSKKPNLVSALLVEKSSLKTNTISQEEIQQVISFDEADKSSLKKEAEPSLQSPFLEGPSTESAIETIANPSPAQQIKSLEIVTGKTQAIPSATSITPGVFNFPEGLDTRIVNEQPVSVEPAPGNTITRQQEAEFPLSIESVTNAFQPRHRGKTSWQISFSPTVSYRKLTENKYYPAAGVVTPGSYPFSTSPTENVNNAVTHKPDLGLEIALTARHPVSKNINLRTGVQFNIRRYDIKAFAYRGELASIDLTGAAGTTTAWTYYRTKSGYKADWLRNFYLTVSLPVGAEVKLFGNKNTSVGIAGTVQPTYIISDKAYLISTDYKNYAEVPSLIRHVNVNTSFETFISYKTGKTQWQVGPQIRYQVLSSFQNKYPIRENLFDFGLKIGVALNNH